MLPPLGVGGEEGSEQRGVGLRRPGGAVVQQADQGGEPDRVGEQNALVVGVVGGFADPVEEVDGEVIFVLGHSDLAGEGMQVADEGGHHLAQARVGCAGHRGQNHVGDAVCILDDAVARHFPRRGRCGRVHVLLLLQSIAGRFTQSIARCQEKAYKKFMAPSRPARLPRPAPESPSDAAPPLPRGATLQQVADAAGVHRSTASRALNPETARLISPDVVARIAETARRLGYRRDLLAASLRTSRTHLVGMLVPDLANPVFAPIVAGVEAALAEHGYAVLVAHAGSDAIGLELVEGLVARRAEGLILATAHARDPVIARCVELGLPTVLVNRADPEGRLSAVTPDDREGMRLAVRRLVGLGHRHIGHIAGPQDVSTGSLRAEGFRSAMAEAGMAPGPVVEADAYTREAGEDAAERLLSRQRGLTAIAAANDLLALGALRALSARGLSCPDDVSVTGHNDMPLVDMVQPPLTTIRIFHDRIGREGARLLLDRIARPDAPLVQIRTSPELIVRASTAAPPGGR